MAGWGYNQAGITDVPTGNNFVAIAAGDGHALALVSGSIPVIEATVDVEPGTLNLQSKAKWLTCYISLPEEYDVADMDPSSILLEGEIEVAWTRLDEEGQVAMARFNRSEVQSMLEPGEAELTVSGELTDGTRFQATDTVTVIDKGGKK